jgi:hypothetical protein
MFKNVRKHVEYNNGWIINLDIYMDVNIVANLSSKELMCNKLNYSLKISFQISCTMSQPYFWKSGKMTLTLLKWGLGSPLGLLKFQSLIARIKTPRIEVFFISLENYQNVDVENGFT